MRIKKIADDRFKYTMTYKESGTNKTNRVSLFLTSDSTADKTKAERQLKKMIKDKLSGK